MGDTSEPGDVRLPALPQPLVHRERLLRRLDEIAERPITCVVAPRGWGKTALVSHWAGKCSPMPVLWLNIAADGGVTRPGGEWLPMSPRDWMQQMRLEEVGEPPGPVHAWVLVLDGVDTPRAADIAMEFLRLASAAAARVRVVLVGCCAPPEMVALRMSGAAWQLPAEELLLDASEVADVVSAYSGQHLREDIAEELTRLVDGWMAAAVLVGFTSSSTDRSAGGWYAAAADSIDTYLSSVILPGLSAELRDFAVATAVVDDLDPSLCTALTGADHAERHLAGLRSAGFPIVLDGSERLRYLRPVRDALERLARRDDPAAHAERLRVAAQWFRDWNRPLDAAGCLVRAGDWHEAERIINEHLPRILGQDEIGRLAEFVRHAPPEILRKQLGAAHAAAWVLRMDGRVSASLEVLDIYAPYFSDRGRMTADVSRASTASWAADTEALVGFADQALEACDQLGESAFAGGDTWHGDSNGSEYRAMAHGAAQLACAYGGMWARGETHLVPIAPQGAAYLPSFRLLELHGITGTYYALSGRARDALIEAHAAMTIAMQSDLIEHRLAADASFALGEALRLSLRPDEAAAPFERALRLADLNGRHNLAATVVASQAQLAIDAARPDVALAMLATYRLANPHRFPPTVGGVLAAAEARALTASGRSGESLRVLEGAPLTSPVASMRAMALLASGEVAGAQAMVKHWPDEPTVDATVRRALAAAVICEHTGDRRSTGLLRKALAAASPHGLAQPFVEHGATVAKLLRPPVTGDNEFALTLQHWLSEHIAVSPTRFTAREDIVMSHLAAGRSVRETADVMHIAVNTVRAHLRAIHRKLGVDNRADAIRAWNERSSRSADD